QYSDSTMTTASVEIGTGGEIFEDISNPCRESELRSSYNRMRTTMWPKCIKEIEKKLKASRKESVDKNEEKKKIKRMIKVIFSFKNHCVEMAVQSLQLKIFWEDCTHYQDMYKQLGHSSPDFLCEIADQCYKQGCLMALHNPPLTLDWDNSDDCPFPPITKNDGAEIL
uniref:Uncharacterized protein n=1 Tax=Sinocyclocheilus grahami TaxID=75366 RepID=A0A672KX41_SINGR